MNEYVELYLKRNRGWPWPEDSWGLTPMFGEDGTPLRPNARSPRSLPVNNGRQAIDLPPVSASRGAFDFRPSFPAGSADRTTSQACRIRPG